jgi:hypothetical protein
LVATFGYIKTEFDWQSAPAQTNGDGKVAGFNAAYTRYLQPLKEGEDPIELRVYLQHPSRFSFGFETGVEKLENQILLGPTFDTFFTNEIKLDYYGISAGGRYYLPTETGFGIAAAYLEGDWTDILSKEEYESKEVSASIDQYIFKNYNLAVSYQWIEDNLFTLERTRQNFIVDASAVVGTKPSFLINIGAGAGEIELANGLAETTDTQEYFLTFGPVWHQFSFIISANYTTYDYEDSREELEDITFGASPRYWFNSNVFMSLEFFYSRTEETFIDINASRPVEVQDDSYGFGLVVRSRF